jgi:flagellar assembly protein FliH
MAEERSLMPGEPLILRDADWMPEALKIGRPRSAGVAASIATAAHAAAPVPAAAPTPSAQWLEQQRRAAYEEGLKAGRKAADAELEQRAQALSHEQAQVREAMAALQREQKELQQRRQAGEQQMSAQRDSLQRLLQQLPAAWEGFLQDAEEDMLSLVFEAVCRITGEQAVSRDGARAMLQRTVQAWHGRRPLSVHVHPDDLDALQSDAPLRQMLSASGFTAERQTLRWVADPEVQLGGCLLRSEEGALDARLEVQLQALGASLAQTREVRREMQREGQRQVQHDQTAADGGPFKPAGEAAR